MLTIMSYDCHHEFLFFIFYLSLKPFSLFLNNHTERELDIKLVESMIESHYHSFSSDVEPLSASTTIHQNDNNSKIWRLMGVNNKSLVSDSRS